MEPLTKATSPVPLAQQVFGGHARALPVLDADGVKGRVLDVAVHQDDGHVHAAQFLQIAPRIAPTMIMPSTPRFWATLT